MPYSVGNAMKLIRKSMKTKYLRQRHPSISSQGVVLRQNGRGLRTLQSRTLWSSRVPVTKRAKEIYCLRNSSSSAVIHFIIDFLNRAVSRAVCRFDRITLRRERSSGIYQTYLGAVPIFPVFQLRYYSPCGLIAECRGGSSYNSGTKDLQRHRCCCHSHG